MKYMCYFLAGFDALVGTLFVVNSSGVNDIAFGLSLWTLGILWIVVAKKVK